MSWLPPQDSCGAIVEWIETSIAAPHWRRFHVHERITTPMKPIYATLAAAIFVFSAGAALAQSGPPAAHGGRFGMHELSPEERQKLRERWQSMTPEEREKARVDHRAKMKARWESMTQEERDRARAAHRARMRAHWESMTPEQRAEMRQRFEERLAQMPPEQRARMEQRMQERRERHEQRRRMEERQLPN